MSDVKLSEQATVAKRTEAVYVQGGIRRTLLQEVDFPQGRTINASIIEVQARTDATPHTHPGVEVGYVLEGEFDLAIEGRPDQNLKVGSSYSVPADAVHYAKVRGDETLKVLCVFVVDETKPLAALESPAS